MSLPAHAHIIKRAARIMCSVIALLLFVTLGAWMIHDVFVLKQIEVVGDPVDIQVDKERLGKNMIFLQTKQLAHDLLGAYPLLDTVTFSKSYPSTLVVRVTLRKPFVVLSTQSLHYELDREGVVLGNDTQKQRMPTLFFDVPPLSIGSRVRDARVVASLQLLSLVSDLPIEEIRQKDSAAILATSGHTNIFIPQSADMRRQAATLQTIVTGFRIKGTLPTVIDLRFDKPIVTY